MNVSGFELVQPVQSVYCRNGFCGSIIPLCFAGISPNCARNRASSNWHHFSFGEHVCQECFNFLNQKHKGHSSASIWRRRMNTWRKEWIHKCSPSGRSRLPSTADFLAAHLLPWWLKCSHCGHWRQLPPQKPIGAPDSLYHPSQFHCSTVNKLCETPCSWPLDERTTLIVNRPQDFLASMKTHAWLQFPSGVKPLSTYGIDLVGLSLDHVPGSPPEDIPGDGAAASFGFSLDGTGMFSPIDMQAWERLCFPEMIRFPTLYLAIRNLILCLWSSNPKSLLTPWTVSSHCFVRGLLRIVLCEHWIPRILDEFTSRGFINIGACRAVDGLFEFNQRDQPRHKSRVQLFGRLDLKNAVAGRQIYNGLILRSRLFQSEAVSHFQICFHFFESCTRTSLDDMENPLSEFHMNLTQQQTESPQQAPSVMVEFDQALHSAHDFKVECPLNDPSLPEGDRLLVLPRHSWIDRVYLYDSHPLCSIASQCNLTLQPLDYVLLFNDPDASHELFVVPTEKRVRMEFHVEAVLDMVTQLCDSDSVTFDEKWLSRSVQDSWDHLNASMRDRLQDLDDSPLERGLIEFYLAAVELDLTEPLTVNFSRSFSSCPTACLDQLPTNRYNEFLIEPALPEAPTSSRWCPPHRIVNSKYHRGVFQHICETLIDRELLLPAPPDIAFIRVLLTSSAEVDNCHDAIHACTSYSLRKKVAGLSPVENISQSVSLILYSMDGREERIDWAVFLDSSPLLRFIFYEDGSFTLPDSRNLETNGSMTIFIPANLRPLLIEDPLLRSTACAISNPDKVNNYNGDEFSARLITVTLVYPRAWWRDRLIGMNLQNASSCVAKGHLHQFAILPSDRENRGFCHVFRDMFPELQSPALIQTQIFAVSANRHWFETDASLSSKVHKYLDTSLKRIVSEDSPNPVVPEPLTYHVARIQHPMYPGLDQKQVSRVLDQNDQLLHMKPDSWEQLSRYCHIIFPNRLFSAGKEESVSGAAFCNRTSMSDGSRLLASNTPGMDAVTSSLLSGLRLAEIALRRISHHPGHITCAIVNDVALMDGSNCAEEFTCSRKTSAHSESTHRRSCFIEQPTRALKRKFTDDDDVVVDSSIESAS